MELIALLFVVALWDVSRHAVGRAREDYRRETGPKPKGKSGKAGNGAGRDPDTAARAHRARGWWLRELGSGFAVTRTGWHAGWLAHRTEADRSRREREEARTLHTEGRRGVLRDVAAFRQRHAAARKEIEDELAAQQAKGSPATGRKAVESAGDEVARKREQRLMVTDVCPNCNAPDGYEHRKGCDRAAPPLPADSVRPADPVVIDTPVRAHNTGDSAHLNPGDRRCEGCGGSGRSADDNDACPVCRGWGSGPPDPMSPLAAADAVCTACGNKGKPGDPVVADPGGNIHLSHAQEQQEAYWDRLNRENARKRAAEEPGADQDADWRGQNRQAAQQAWLRDPDETPVTSDRAEEEPGADAARNPQPVVRTANGTPLDPDMPRALMTEDELAQLDGQPATTASPTTQGAPVTDTNYDVVMENARKRADEAEQDAVAAAQRHQAAMQHAEDMQAVGVQGNTLSAQMELVDQLKHAEDAAKATGEQAVAVRDALAKEHGGIKSAVDDAPIPRPAESDFYVGS